MFCNLRAVGIKLACLITLGLIVRLDDVIFEKVC